MRYTEDWLANKHQLATLRGDLEADMKQFTVVRMTEGIGLLVLQRQNVWRGGSILHLQRSKLRLVSVDDG